MYGFATEEHLVAHMSSLSKQEDKDVVEDILGGIVFTNPFPKPDQLPINLSVSQRECVLLSSIIITNSSYKMNKQD